MSTGQLLVWAWWQSWQPNESMKYSNLPINLLFQPIAVENLGAFSSSSSDFISAEIDFDHKISSVSGEERETSFVFQRLCVIATLQCKVLRDTFVSQDDPDQKP